MKCVGQVCSYSFPFQLCFRYCVYNLLWDVECNKAEFCEENSQRHPPCSYDVTFSSKPISLQYICHVLVFFLWGNEYFVLSLMDWCQGITLWISVNSVGSRYFMLLVHERKSDWPRQGLSQIHTVWSWVMQRCFIWVVFVRSLFGGFVWEVWILRKMCSLLSRNRWKYRWKISWIRTRVFRIS